jgi:probable RNA-binding protein EIF1AD
MTSRKGRLAPAKHQQQDPVDPPPELTPTQHISKVIRIHGNALYTVNLPSNTELLVELPIRFRNSIWVRRGGFVLIDTEGYGEGKVTGKIQEVVRNEKAWRRMSYWFAFHFRC